MEGFIESAFDMHGKKQFTNFLLETISFLNFDLSMQLLSSLVDLP